MLLRTRVLLRGTLLAAAAHSALAQTCASYCHWDIKNCLVSEQHCRGCDACVAAAAKSGPTDGCYSWCSAAQDHCAKEKAKCGGCDFCGGQSAPCSPKVGGDREYLSCEGWCSESGKEDHCKLCGCKGCGFCGGSIARPNEELVVAQSPPPPPSPSPPPARADDKWYCYALRYPDLLQGFCNGDVDKCRWTDLQDHYRTQHAVEGRTNACKAEDVQCYAARYPDLLAGFCKEGKGANECKWLQLLDHWAFHGQHEERTFDADCESDNARCYADRYPDVVRDVCHGDVFSCPWLDVVVHFSTVGEKEGRIYGCLDSPPPSPPPPPEYVAAGSDSALSPPENVASGGYVASGTAAVSWPPAPPLASFGGKPKSSFAQMAVGVTIGLAILIVASVCVASFTYRSISGAPQVEMMDDDDDDYDDDDDFDDEDPPPTRKSKKGPRGIRMDHDDRAGYDGMDD